MDKNSELYEDGEVEDFFEAIRRSHMAAKDVVPYSQSIARLPAYQAALDYYYMEGVKEGREIAKAKAKAYEEAIKEGISIVARRLKAAGMDINHISEVTGLSPEQILGL